MFCRKCGKQILDDSCFCQFCGTAVQLYEEQTIEQELLITAKEAKEGAVKKISIEGASTPIEVKLPPKILDDGKILALHKVKLLDSNGKKVKKDVFLKIRICPDTEGGIL